MAKIDTTAGRLSGVDRPLPGRKLIADRALKVQGLVYRAQAIVRLASNRLARGDVNDNVAVEIQFALDSAGEILDSASEAGDFVTLLAPAAQEVSHG